jgi:hypothetical protein
MHRRHHCQERGGRFQACRLIFDTKGDFFRKLRMPADPRADYACIMAVRECSGEGQFPRFS